MDLGGIYLSSGATNCKFVVPISYFFSAILFAFTVYILFGRFVIGLPPGVSSTNIYIIIVEILGYYARNLILDFRVSRYLVSTARISHFYQQKSGMVSSKTGC